MAHPKRKPSRLWLLPVMLAAAGLCYLDNFAVQTTYPTLTCPELPEAFDGLRIVHLSDLHGRVFGREHKTLLAAVRDAAPDLIVITGDLADEGTSLSALCPLLAALPTIAPTFYVTGNHEWALPVAERKQFFTLLRENGITRLAGDYRVLTRGQSRLILAGVDDPNGPADQKTAPELIREIRAEQGEDAFILALCHRNDQLPLWAGLEVPLVLAGHAHGGVIRIPGLGGVFGTNFQLFPGDEAGLYTQGRTQFYVSRGLGPSRHLPLRVCNPPELALLTLRRCPPPLTLH